MLSLIEYLAEAADKNQHLEHIEDLVFEGGVIGTRDAIRFLLSLRDMLAGHVKSSVNLTTKWDGAPAIIAGINPENGRFFVASKSAFNKTPKLNYTSADVDRNHPNEGLNYKLKVALRYLPELGMNGIFQGDMMFTHADLKKEKLNGGQFITFQPNTIIYAVPENSTLANQIKAAQMGIVWHTHYTGPDIPSLKASFGVNVGQFRQSRNVWFRDASFVDVSGTATFTQAETDRITAVLSQAGNIFRSISPRVLNELSTSNTYRLLVKTWINKTVREGQVIPNTGQQAYQMIKYVADKHAENVSTAKKEDTRTKRSEERNRILRFFRENSGQIKLIFDLYNLLISAKLMIVKKLEQAEQATHTFVRDSNGLKTVRPEGVVCVDKIGKAVKLVDRMTFSHNNFNVSKDWSQ